MNSWYKYYQHLARKIQNYLSDEIQSALCYQMLATHAPDHQVRGLLLQFAAEENTQVSTLRRLHQQLTGKPVPSRPLLALPDVSYGEGLRQRVLAEGAAFANYGDEFLNAPDPYLRNLFYRMGAVAVQHGLCLSFFLNQPNSKT